MNPNISMEAYFLNIGKLQFHLFLRSLGGVFPENLPKSHINSIIIMTAVVSHNAFLKLFSLNSEYSNVI